RKFLPSGNTKGSHRSTTSHRTPKEYMTLIIVNSTPNIKSGRKLKNLDLHPMSRHESQLCHTSMMEIKKLYLGNHTLALSRSLKNANNGKPEIVVSEVNYMI